MDSEAAEEKKDAGDGSPPGRAEAEAKDQGDAVSPPAEAGGEEASKVEEGGDGASETPKEAKRKRGRRRRSGEKSEKGEGEGEGQEETPKSERKRRPATREGVTPVDRPWRERKAVERFSAMSPRKAAVPKTPSFKQGAGEKLKDIPNVFFKLSKRKADENVRALHTILFGKKSTVRFLKRNILQFSGFVWSENEEKQRLRLKEKLDKHNKERLLDFCDLLDIHVVKATTKKEEVLANLVEFLESPCITRDVVLVEKKGKKRRRTKGTSGEASVDAGKVSKRRKKQKQSAEDGNGDNKEAVSADAKQESSDNDNDDGDDGNTQEESEHSQSEQDEEDEQEEPAPAKKRSASKLTMKTAEPSKKKGKVTPKNISVSKGSSQPALEASSEDEPSSPHDSKNSYRKEMNEKSSKVSTKEKASTGKKSPKLTKSSSTPLGKTASVDDASESKKDDGRKGRGKEKPASKKEEISKKKSSKSESKGTTKKEGKGKSSAATKNEPSTEELHAVISNILKEVDFNTATLADILRQLGTHFNMNMMDRKAEVKLIIEDVINSMSDDEDGEEDAKDDDAKEDSDEDGDK